MHRKIPRTLAPQGERKIPRTPAPQEKGQKTEHPPRVEKKQRIKKTSTLPWKPFQKSGDLGDDGDAVDVRGAEPEEEEPRAEELPDPVFFFRPPQPAVWPPNNPEEGRPTPMRLAVGPRTPRPATTDGTGSASTSSSNPPCSAKTSKPATTSAAGSTPHYFQRFLVLFPTYCHSQGDQNQNLDSSMQPHSGTSSRSS